MVPYNFLHILPLFSLFVPKSNNFLLFLISREDWPRKYWFHKVCIRWWFKFETKTLSSFGCSRIYATWNDGRLRRSLSSLFLGLVVIVRRLMRLYFLICRSFCNFSLTLLIADWSWSTHVTQLWVNFLPHGLGSVTFYKGIERLNIIQLECWHLHLIINLMISDVIPVVHPICIITSLNSHRFHIVLLMTGNRVINCP